MSTDIAPWVSRPISPTPHAVAPVAVKHTTYVRWIKPTLDRAGALLLLVVLSPLFLVISACILVTIGRPIIFRQERVGLGGKVFQVRKFRTMKADRRALALPVGGQERRRYHKSEADPRHTGLGRTLRRFSLDELPQLVNVLVGDMSLVGPRPELTSVVRTYRPAQHRRHAVRPGITGTWQVSARGAGPMHEFTHLDLSYVDQVSLLTDVRLLARTIPAAIVQRLGA